MKYLLFNKLAVHDMGGMAIQGPLIVPDLGFFDFFICLLRTFQHLELLHYIGKYLEISTGYSPVLYRRVVVVCRAYPGDTG